MGRLIIVFGLFLFSLNLAKAQSVQLIEDANVARLMQKYVELNRYQETVEGWRIQLLATTDRRKMETAKTTFQSKYPGIPLDWTHEPPYYKLRCGAFVTKLDAIRTLQGLKRDFPSAYPAKDNKLLPLDLINANY